MHGEKMEVAMKELAENITTKAQVGPTIGSTPLPPPSQCKRLAYLRK